MKYSKFLLVICFALVGCKTHPNPKEPFVMTGSEIVYGLDDETLDFLARRLGCHVEPLGMSDYEFSCEKITFRVLAHNDISVESRVQADESVILRYESSNGRHEVESQIEVAKGVKLADVENKFREFIRRVNEKLGVRGQ